MHQSGEREEQEDGHSKHQMNAEYKGDTISIELRDDGDIRLLTPVEGVEYEDNLIVRYRHFLVMTTFLFAPHIHRLAQPHRYLLVIVIVSFEHSSNLAAAYGIAVTGTMVET